MNAELIFSGVPKGEDYWGPHNDQIYFSTFYNGNKYEGNRFLVEVRRSGDKTYSYYSYLKSNTSDFENRSGGYFCMSLRLDMLCLDVVNLYHYMDMIFNKYVNNNFLIQTSNILRYQITNFGQKQNDIQLCQSNLIELIQNYMTGNDFVAFDESFKVTKTIVPEFNFNDCTKDNVLAAIKKNAAIICSSSALLQREQIAQQSFDSRLTSATKAKEDEISNLKKAHQTIKTQYTQLQTEITQLRDENERLKNEIKQKDAEIKQNSLRQNVSQIVSQIKDPINKLASFTEQSFQDHRKGTQKKEQEQSSFMETIVKWIIPVLNFLVLLGIGAYLLYLGVTKSDNNGSSSSLYGNDTKIESLADETDKTEADLIKPEVELPVITPISTNRTEQVTVDAEPTVVYDFSSVKIDISPYKGGDNPLIYGTTYTVKVVNAPAEGKWKVDHLMVESEKPQEIVVIANEKGPVSISYEIGTQAKKRELIVE